MSRLRTWFARPSSGQPTAMVADDPPPTGPPVVGLESLPADGAVEAVLGGADRRRKQLISVLGFLVAAVVLAIVLAGKRHEFVQALRSASIGTLAIATVLQVVALLSRSEAWHRCIIAAGGTIRRRVLFRASSMGSVGSLLNAQVGVAARIGALRRTAKADCPCVTTLLAAELPIVAVEATLAALTSFTLVGPLNLPWFVPVLLLGGMVGLSAGLRHLAARTTRKLFRGLAVLRCAKGGKRLVAFVLIAVFAQILRNWLLLNAVGVHASLFDSIAVLIAMISVSQLPVGPASGAAAAVLILGSDGVAAVAAAGMLTTVTGTAGGLSFAAWGGLDRLRQGRVASSSRPPAAPRAGRLRARFARA